MPYLFKTPTVLEGPIGENHRLWQFYKLDRGVTVIKANNGYAQVRFPTQDLLDSVEAYYLGGHEYEVSNDEAASLTAAGYGSYLTEII
jgi:hypothetical protein